MLLQRAAMESGRSSGGDHLQHDPVLPPGYRFYPTEEELLCFYLRHRLAGTRPQVEHFIPVVDIYSHHPSDLRAMAGAANVCDKEQWFFFCPRAERELSGGRPARTTPTGYWKATGSPSYVYSAAPNSSRVLGEKRTMVFYEGRAPTGNKTRWKMNEYKAVAAGADDAPPGAPVRLRNEFSVCRVYTSNGTLRSFDRRPLNPPPGGGLDQAAAAHRRDQQQQALPPPPPPPPPPPASQLMAAVDAVAGASNGQSSEHDSHGSSSSSGSLGAVVDGAEDAAAAIDWDALIPPVDYLRLSADDLSHVVWPPN